VATYHLANFSLDSAVLAILIKNDKRVKETCVTGIARVHSELFNIVKSSKEGVDSLIISGFFVEPTHLQKAIAHFRHVTYIDGHKESEVYAALQSSKFSFNYKEGLPSATIYAMKTMPKSRELQRLTIASNAFSGWDTSPAAYESFRQGYGLNLLLWEYKVDAFIDQFMGGFTSFNSIESDLIQSHIDSASSALDACDQCVVEDESFRTLSVVMESPSYINDVSLKYTGYDVYLIVYTDRTGGLHISVRNTCKKFDIDTVMCKVREHDEVENCGGVASVFGVSFARGTSADQVFDFLEILHSLLKESL